MEISSPVETLKEPSQSGGNVTEGTSDVPPPVAKNEHHGADKIANVQETNTSEPVSEIGEVRPSVTLTDSTLLPSKKTEQASPSADTSLVAGENGDLDDSNPAVISETGVEAKRTVSKTQPSVKVPLKPKAGSSVGGGASTSSKAGPRGTSIASSRLAPRASISTTRSAGSTASSSTSTNVAAKSSATSGGLSRTTIAGKVIPGRPPVSTGPHQMSNSATTTRSVPSSSLKRAELAGSEATSAAPSLSSSHPPPTSSTTTNTIKPSSRPSSVASGISKPSTSRDPINVNYSTRPTAAVAAPGVRSTVRTQVSTTNTTPSKKPVGATSSTTTAGTVSGVRAAVPSSTVRSRPLTSSSLVKPASSLNKVVVAKGLSNNKEATAVSNAAARQSPTIDENVYRQKIEELETKLATTKDELSKIQSSFFAKEGEQEEVKGQLAQLAAVRDDTIEKLTERLSKSEEQIKTKDEEITQFREGLKSQDGEKSELKSAILKSKEEAEKAEKKLEEAQAQHAKQIGNFESERQERDEGHKKELSMQKKSHEGSVEQLIAGVQSRADAHKQTALEEVEQRHRIELAGISSESDKRRDTEQEELTTKITLLEEALERERANAKADVERMHLEVVTVSEKYAALLKSEEASAAEELRRAKSAHSQDSAAHVKELETVRGESRASMERIRSEHKSDLGTLKTNHNLEATKIKDELQKEIASLKNEIAVVTGNLVTANQQNSTLKKNLESSAEHLKTAQEASAAAEKASASAATSAVSSDDQDKLRSHLLEVEKELEASKSDLQDLKAALTKTQEDAAVQFDAIQRMHDQELSSKEEDHLNSISLLRKEGTTTQESLSKEITDLKAKVKMSEEGVTSASTKSPPATPKRLAGFMSPAASPAMASSDQVALYAAHTAKLAEVESSYKTQIEELKADLDNANRELEQHRQA